LLARERRHERRVADVETQLSELRRQLDEVTRALSARGPGHA
jgi:hypothetical protein